MEKEKMTYEEYRAEVKNILLQYNLTDAEIETYLKKEGEEEIKERYECLNSEDEGIRATGSPYSVAHCLSLMYE